MTVTVVSITVPEWVDEPNPEPDPHPDPTPDPEGDPRFWQVDAPAGMHVVNHYVRRPIHQDHPQPWPLVDRFVVDDEGRITGVVFLAELAADPALGVSNTYTAHIVCAPIEP